MGLVNCPECGKEISDHAAACPNCACPIAAQPAAPPPATPATPRPTIEEVQTIRQTSKEHKRRQVIGYLVCFGSLVLILLSCVVNNYNVSRGCFTLGVLGLVTGLIIYFTAKVGDWWGRG